MYVLNVSEGAFLHFRAAMPSPTLAMDFGLLEVDHGRDAFLECGQTTMVLLYEIGVIRKFNYEERGRGTPNDLG